MASHADHKPSILKQLAFSFQFVDSLPPLLLTLFHSIGHILSTMNSLRAEARQRFGAEQQFKKGEDLQLTTMKLVTIAKFIDSETTVRQTSVEWPGYLDICDLVNAPVSNNDNKKATMTMNIVEFRHDGRGILCINRRVLMNFFDDFGFDVYWLHMLCWSAFGFFQQVSRGGIFRHCFRQTELWTILWAHECISKTTKVLAIERVAYQVSSDDFIRFLLTINYHKDLIDDWRFCSFLCGSSLVHRLEYSIKHNLEQIQHAEAITGHGLGAWHDAFSRVYPATDELVTVSRSLGLVIAALAGEIRDFCTARKLLHDLISPLPSQWIHHQPVQNLSPASSPPHKDDIADIAEILGSNIQSIGIQASVIQERGRIQQSVVC
jgi:hypothetical protein